MRKYLVSVLVLVLVAMLGIVGCGGGSSSDKKQGNKGETEQPDNTGDKQTPTTLPQVDGKVVFTKSYLKGKTLYLASPKDKDVVSFVFDESSFSGEVVYRVASSLSYGITSKGYISFMEPDSGKEAYFKPLSQDKDKISVAFSYDEASLANITKANKYFYFVKEKAVEYIKTVKADDTTSDKGFEFTKEYLSGKTLYHVSVVDKSGFQTFIFSQNDFQAKDSSSGQVATISYSITSEGYMSYQEPDGDKKTAFYKVLNKDDDKISMAFSYDKNKLEQDTGVDKFFYFDKTKAEAFVALKK